MFSFPVRRACLGLLAVVIVACGADRAAAQTTLRYKFKKGDKLNYEMEQKMTMTMSIMGRDINTDVNQLVNMTWTVNDVDADGKAKMTQTIARIRHNMDGGPVGKFEYDSKDDKEGEGPLGKILTPILRALAGAEINLVMDPQGKISDIKLPEKLAKIAKNLPPAAAAGGAGEMLSEEGLKQMMDQGGLRLPKEAVAKGKTWDQQFEMKSAIGKVKAESVNTYEGPAERDGKKLERVAMKPKLTFEVDENSPAKITVKSQDAKGTAYFDNAAGKLVSTSMNQDLELAISGGGQEFTGKLKQSVSMKLLDK